MAYNVLIVDDSRSMRNVIKKVLKISGLELGDILEAGNGREALDRLGEAWVDLILSDVNMPEMDGIEFLRALSQHEDFRDVPVVLVTTESNEKRLEEAMALGAKGYLRKPFQPEDVRSLVLETLGVEDEWGLDGSDEGCDF
ncbi:two-component system, chemotaxis family, response regulator CheY [Desulfacinum hydrothermale DSM 13146]|uniref:Two-component system, chemotaxis family, response regulator CheY n=1 Tax=Desulfacinum hydrothermale DSM 13146 TaxID=1121390 RepID=A0A1W1X687_9BACT|nr:response regulator [Desulfacinum hydrothermale]SMC19445.1 two-component system, chemotaxis family, response regulator CheY [Desulfacinum hydrothermale DSM 13146]